MQKRTTTITVKEFESGRVQVDAAFDPPVLSAAGEKTLGMSSILPILLPLTASPDIVIQYNGVTSDGEHDPNVPLSTLSFNGTPMLKKG